MHRVLPARNLLAGAATPRFEVDPGALVAGEAAARREGWELVGIWHSHVDRAALLSAADRDGAWGGHHQLVLALVGTDGVEARSYRCRSERAGGSSPTWVEEELRVVPTASPSRLTPRS